MPSVEVTVDLEIPKETLIYDIGTEHLCCRVCNKGSTAFRIVGQRKTRGGSPSIEKVFQTFMEQHANCVMKLREKKIMEKAD